MRLTGALKKLHFKTPSIYNNTGQWPACEPARLPPVNDVIFGDKDSDVETSVSSSQSLAVRADHIPKGFFAVHVGEISKRYVIPLSYLKHHAFVALLKQAEEEFGFSHNGAIRLPCGIDFFEHLIWLLSREDPSPPKMRQSCTLVYEICWSAQDATMY